PELTGAGEALNEAAALGGDDEVRVHVKHLFRGRDGLAQHRNAVISLLPLRLDFVTQRAGANHLILLAHLKEVFGGGLAQGDDALRLFLDRDLHAAVVDGAPTLGGGIFLRARNKAYRQGHTDDACADPQSFILHVDLPTSLRETSAGPQQPHRQPTRLSLWRSIDTRS